MITMFPGIIRAVRLIAFPAIILSISLLAYGCGDETTPTGSDTPVKISGSLVDATDCKDYIYGGSPASPAVLDCVFWYWDGSDTLRVVHVNAALNCCPGTIVGEVTVNGSDIFIYEDEGEDAPMCRCLCLYDLAYKVWGINGGIVTIAFYEKYIGEGAGQLDVTIDLEAEPTGTRCLQRNIYPWGTIYSGSSDGTIDDYSGCKDVTGTYDDTEPFSADTSCVTVYKLEVDNTLKIYHTNTAYNCCVEALDAAFEFSEGLVTITGMEYPPGGLCDCTCLYDVTYSIYNLEPGVYTIRFVEPYLPQGQQQIEVIVDMSEEGPWTSCAVRDGYPWSSETSEEQDRAKLKDMFDDIVEYIGTPYCSGEDDCRIIGAGSKPCGGPWMYLIYSASTVDEEHLQGLVSEHASYEDYMNMKYGYMSTCDVPAPPILECHEGICREAR
jgi:hypothetical protein